MPPPVKSRFWHRARLTFRWFRITVWLLVLAVICALLWLNRVGLPDFLMRPLLAELRAQGLEMECSRVRLRWYRGIVAENVRFAQAKQTTGLRATAQELVLRLDHAALWHRQFKLHGVALIDGRLEVPFAATNAPLRQLVVERWQSQVDFHSADRWQLSTFEGRCLGIDFQLSGTVAHAPALLALKPSSDATARQQAEFWNRMVAQLEQLQFMAGALMKGTFSSDAQAMAASSARLEISAPQFKSPWATGRDMALALEVIPQSNALIQVQAKFSARRSQTPWGQAAHLQLTARADVPLAAPELRHVRLNLNGSAVQTPWGRASTLQLDAESFAPFARRHAEDSRIDLKAGAVHTTWATVDNLTFLGTLAVGPTNPALARGTWELRGQGLRSRWFDATNVILTASTAQVATNFWPDAVTAKLSLLQPGVKGTNATSDLLGRAQSARIDAEFILPPLGLLASTNVSWLSRLEKAPATVHAELDSLQVARFEAERIAFDAKWSAPVLQVDPLQARLYGGQLTATARLDVATRELTMNLHGEIDPHNITPLFTTNTNEWKSLVSCERPSHLQAGLRLTLPAWTNQAPDWRVEVLPTLAVAGTVQAGAGVARTVPFTSAQAAFAITNLFWQVRDFEVTRPEGRLTVSLDSDAHSQVFHASLTNSLDPTALRPALDSEPARIALDYFQFTEPPRLGVEIWGRWGDWASVGLEAQAAFTNLTFRAQAVKSVVARITYTNQVLDVFNPRVEREEGVGTADQVRVDFVREVLGFTKVHSHLDPIAFAHTVGPRTLKTLSPYRFAHPPTIDFEGTVGINSGSGYDDARFKVSGGPFQWQNFRLTNVDARVHWLRDTLTITNFKGAICDGEVEGHAFFDFAADVGTDFRFALTATNVNARPLLTDLFPTSTNQLDGFLSGQLVITNASDIHMTNWFGYGQVSLRDGMIWNQPVFRLFSPMLNAIVPGLGNSRARQATSTFRITNSIIATSDLDIRATGMRMQFDGTVDFEGIIQGRMQADLLRDVPAFGWLVSKVLWPVTKVFEYKITGTLAQPKTQPLYIPKIFMAPFHPLRTMKELFGDDKEK